MTTPFRHSAAAVAVLSAISASPVAAQETPRHYDLPAQPLGQAIQAIARLSGVSILAPGELLAKRRAAAINGDLTVAEALARALAGTGLHAEAVSGGYVVRADDPQAADASPADPIVVTGTRLSGAPVASTVVTIDRSAIRDAGASGLGDVVRALPQSFGGGQNPGVGTNVPAKNGVDIGGGSSIDLRGIGSDATLTLLNGHRLSYSASRQSVDVSAIPLGAVERIEIVPDGASALYGSDAVAGVANVILRRDVHGVETSARLGSSTDGGYFQQVYGVLTGIRWGSGNLVAAYEYGSNSSIIAADRSYAATRSPGLTLFPKLAHHSASLNLRQALGSRLTFTLDALFNRRTSDTIFPLNFAGDLSLSRGRLYGPARSFEVTPTLALAVGAWRATLLGGFGRDRIDYAADLVIGGVASSGGAGFYRNTASFIELNAAGPLFALPGGAARLAIGGGWRGIDFQSFKGSSSYQNLVRSQDNAYAFAELALPVWRGVDLNGALRYENYPGIGDVVTPKVGGVVAVAPWVSVKASWGQSFRAPTLLEQYDPASVSLRRVTSVGGSGYPANATALYLQGGNAALRPERATTWSATLDLHPKMLGDAHIEIGYFSIAYRDRIVTPIGSAAVALANPIYRDQITLAPSAALQASILANAGTFLNSSGAPYDPATVVALIDNSNVNAGRQSIGGIDILARDQFRVAEGLLTATLNATYLTSTQQLSPSQPVIDLAGTIFNPPHWRARGGLGWARGTTALNAFVNYTGSVEDRRFAPIARLGAVTTVDATLRIGTGATAGPLANLDVTVAVLNAFNAKPTPIRTTLFTDTPYDSTSYSPVGRFVSIGITKKW